MRVPKGESADGNENRPRYRAAEGSVKCFAVLVFAVATTGFARIPQDSPHASSLSPTCTPYHVADDTR